MEDNIVPIPGVFTKFVNDTIFDLIAISNAVEIGDYATIKAKLNSIHLDAREQRDYLYRIEEKNASTETPQEMGKLISFRSR